MSHASLAWRRVISRSRYHRAFSRSSMVFPFSSALQMYFTALPRQKLMCSVTVMHYSPLDLSNVVDEFEIKLTDDGIHKIPDDFN